MDTTKACSHGVVSLQSQVRQFLGRFAQTGLDALSSLVKPDQLEALVRQHCAHYWERSYPPLTTVSLFLEQVLGAESQLPRRRGARFEQSGRAKPESIGPEHRPVLQSA